MTVAELIAKLQTLPPDAVAVIEDGEGGGLLYTIKDALRITGWRSVSGAMRSEQPTDNVKHLRGSVPFQAVLVTDCELLPPRMLEAAVSAP